MIKTIKRFRKNYKFDYIFIKLQFLIQQLSEQDLMIKQM